MTEENKEKKQANNDERNETLRHQSSGIEERLGKVPLWIWIVSIILLTWGIYYLIKYW